MIVTFLAPSAKRTIGGVLAIYELANGLARRGHEVHLVHLPVVRGHVEALADLDWFAFDTRVEHHLAGRLEPASLPAADFVELTAIEFFADPAAPERHGTLPPSAGLPFLLVQAYGIFPELVDARAFRAPGLKVCVARWLLDVLAGKGVPPSEVAYVPNGLDHGTFRVRRPLAGRPPQVAMLYNAHPTKGARHGLAALADLRRRRPDAGVIVFANQDPDRPLPDGVRLVLLPPRAELADLVYNGSRVFLCPSTVEGFGLASVEAMACGCALVTTDNGGSRDYAVDGENALVCEPRDATAMADRIEQLLADDGLCERIATAGVATAERFSWDESARRLEERLERYALEVAGARRAAAE